MNPPRGLGRGLDSLIPSGSTSLRTVPIDAVSPNPQQPRQSYDPETLAELSESIKEHGVLQPLIVTEQRQPTGASTYRIIAGERRWRAAKLAGLATVPVVVKEATSQTQLELALVENIQRADLNPLEAAAAYHQLVEEFGLSQEQVAGRVGKNRSTVANALRLLKLVEEARQALLDGNITEGHARAILGLIDPSLQRKALAAVLSKSLNVRQTEDLVRRWLEKGADQETRRADLTPEDQDIVDLFQKSLGTKVELTRSRKGGKLVIHFYSEEELTNLHDRLTTD